MIKQRLTIDKTDSGYVLNVDGGSIECETDAELVNRFCAEMGMTQMRASKEMFELYTTAKKERDEYLKDRDRYKEWWYKLHEENRQLKAAIVGWFARAFKEG
jgi:hypothetical protein